MKWSITNLLKLILLPVLSGMYLPLAAQQRDMAKDTIFIVKYDTIYNYQTEPTISTNKYEKRLNRYIRRWKSLIPTYTKLQFAGNMGLLSIGTGWDYGKKNQWETDILFGFIPKYESKRAKVTFTLKENYIPWDLRIKESDFSISPLTCGLYLNTVLGNEFWISEPDRYPKGYYGFSSKVRIHIYLGQQITYHIPRIKRFRGKAISLYYELSTCDLYIVSAATNHYLRPRDYLSLSFGIKTQIL